MQDDYRWLSVIKLRFSSDSDLEFDRSVFFDDLISSPIYQNNYLTPWRGGSQDARGPFAISSLDSNLYIQLTKTEFLSEFFAVLKDPYYLEPTKMMLSQINQINLFSSQQMIYFKLAKQHRPTKFHNNEYEFDFEWSSILWEFVEFDVVDIKEKLIYLLVFGFD